MKNFFTKNKGIIISAAIVLIALAVVYVYSGNSTVPVSSGSVENSSPVADGNICRISIKCDDILNNMGTLTPDKTELVPRDGIIIGETDITFTPGETVFDILKRISQEKGIHLDFSMTPGAYIKGIGNLYEQDCGSMSGWGFYINGQSPTKGCSDIEVNPGDIIEWTYTCDFSKLY